MVFQDLALAKDERLSVYNRCAVHALSASYLNLISQLTTVPAFCQHVHEVCVCVRVCKVILCVCVFYSNCHVVCPGNRTETEGGALSAA